MNSLVLIKRQDNQEIPVTTSKIIAEGTKNTQRSVYLLIEKYKSDFEEFGRLSFEMTPLKTKGGIQDTKIYYLNEDQALLLITYLRNNEIVRKLKIALIKEFSAMKNLLSQKQTQQWQESRVVSKPIRLVLTETIKALPESPHKHFKYKQYTDLVYKLIFNKNTVQLREFYGIGKKESPRDYFTCEELEIVTKLEHQVSTLIEVGMQYEEIKTLLSKKMQPLLI